MNTKHSPKIIKRRVQGFTLIEIMVVLVIAGILLVSAIILTPGSGQSSLERELQRLTTLLGVARDRAMLEANPYGVVIWSEGYAFYRLSGDWRWIEVLNDSLLKQHEWHESQWPDLFLDGLKVTLATKKPASKPQLYLFADGNTSSFILHLREGVDEKRVLHFDASGEGEIFAAEE